MLAKQRSIGRVQLLPQESDTLHLAYNIQGINPVYLPDSYDKPQSSSDILQHFDIKKGIFVIILQAATELPPVPEDNKPKRKKRITKSKSFMQEPEVKLEPGIKLELQEPEVVRDLRAEPIVRKKRSFSIALKDEDQKGEEEGSLSYEKAPYSPARGY
ncbi:uncharacterized protein BDV14DRAFT_206533 [Aspergillus stella-maris]|uniref:uncharacterized protein n=1 Tax=Aspergillus stella-maris TaxID=1810926 RepID=UPI003CCD3E29